MNVRHHVWRKSDTAHHQADIMPSCKAWWWQHHAMEIFVRIDGKMNAANLLQITQDFKLEQRFTQPRYQKSLQNNSVNILEWPEPRLESDWKSLEISENFCATTLPTQIDGDWEVLRREMSKTAQREVCWACSIIRNAEVYETLWILSGYIVCASERLNLPEKGNSYHQIECLLLYQTTFQNLYFLHKWKVEIDFCTSYLLFK